MSFLKRSQSCDFRGVRCEEKPPPFVWDVGHLFEVDPGKSGHRHGACYPHAFARGINTHYPLLRSCWWRAPGPVLVPAAASVTQQSNQAVPALSSMLWGPVVSEEPCPLISCVTCVSMEISDAPGYIKHSLLSQEEGSPQSLEA